MFTAVMIMVMSSNSFAVESFPLTFDSKAACMAEITQSAVNTGKASDVNQIAGTISYMDMKTNQVGIIACVEGNEHTAKMEIERTIRNEGNIVL